MPRRRTIRPSLVFVLICLTCAAVLYHADFVGRVAYAFERGRLQADVDHLAEINAEDVASLEQLSHAFSVVAQAVMPSVVNIRADTPNRELMENEELMDRLRRRFGENWKPRPQRGTGSGVIFDENGHIVTNNHVVSGAERIRVSLADGRRFNARIVGSDAGTDVAVIKIDADRLHPARFGDSGAVKVGHVVLAVGSPFRLDHTISHGIISAIDRDDVPVDITYKGFLQTDAPINPGNSGGPLINCRGEVIGINTAIATETGGHQGVGFSIPSNTVVTIAESLKTGPVVRGYLGVYMWPLEPDLAATYGLDEARGVLVRDFPPDMASPAERDGVKREDVILSVNGQSVSSMTQLQKIITTLKPGAQVKLAIWRNKERKTVTVTLGELPAAMAANMSRNRPERTPDADDGTDSSGDPKPEDDAEEKDADSPFRELGFQAETVSPRLRRSLRLDRSIQTGAVVTQVDPIGEAFDAGLQEHSVIVRANDRRITNVDQLRQALSSRALQSGVRLWVIHPKDGQIPVLLKKP